MHENDFGLDGGGADAASAACSQETGGALTVARLKGMQKDLAAEFALVSERLKANAGDLQAVRAHGSLSAALGGIRQLLEQKG